jgi:hypothetical protein
MAKKSRELSLIRASDPNKVSGLGRLLLTVGLASLFGCVTPQSEPPLVPPAIILPAFQVCHPTEDFGAVQVYKNGDFLGSADLEWIAREGELWTVGILDPIGQRLVDLTCCENGLTAQGPWSDRLPSLGLTTNGQMELGGHPTGVLAAEVPCLLAGKLPQPWLSNLRRMQAKDQNRWRLSFEGDWRRIELELQNNVEGSVSGSCATFVTSHFFGLKKNKLEWCIDRGGTLRGVDGYEIKWSRYE